MARINDTQSRFVANYGPWAVVTGASSGIGRELAIEISRRGVNLVLIARNEALLKTLAAELTASRAIDCRVVAVDLSAESSIERINDATKDLDVGLIVESAGFGTSGLFVDSSLDCELEMLHVNCRALTALAWHFGRRFVDRGRGGMVLMSSIVGFQGMPHAAHYAATKAYVQALAEALAVELSPRGVDVLAAAPGPTHSGFAARAGMKMGMASKPHEVAGPILRALGRRSTLLPGFLSRVLVYSLVLLPRWARVRIMGRVMYGMTR